MTINKKYELIKRVKIHTSPLVEADVVMVGKFQKETKLSYIFDGFRVSKRCVTRIKEIEEVKTMTKEELIGKILDAHLTREELAELTEFIYKMKGAKQ